MSLRRNLSLAIAVTALAGCAGNATAQGPQLAADAALPTEVPAGTRIIVGDPVTQKALELSGELGKLSADIEWANISGGPQTTEAFRAGALDVGSVAEIPPIHATWTGLKIKIVASKFRKDAVNHPLYELGIAPGVQVKTLQDLKGKKIAYSPGQAQGALVLKALQKAGLTKDDVTLVELPSTGDVYSTALAGKQVDVAPIGGVQIKRYVAKYGKDGATTIQHGLRDDPSHLYALRSSLEDPAKAAAIRELVQAWARATRWVYEHPQEWIEGYYVKDQGLSAADGQWLVDRAGEPDVPADLTGVLDRHQQTIDLLAKETGNQRLEAQDLYDQRFVPVAAASYRAEGAK
jgi:sulfonate transport system substrate-binding protein